MQAIIADNDTGSNIATYELAPGSNEISIRSLDSGVYLIELEDHNHDIFYRQKIKLGHS